MQATHAKPIEQTESIPQTARRQLLTREKAIPFNAGLKNPCQCGSGKKFKACCYKKAAVDFGWVVIGEENLVPVAIKSPEFSEHPVILTHPTYLSASEYVRDVSLERKLRQRLLLVRMNVNDLAKHIELQFPPDGKVLIVCPEEITADGEGNVIEVTPGKGITDSTTLEDKEHGDAARAVENDPELSQTVPLDEALKRQGLTEEDLQDA